MFDGDILLLLCKLTKHLLTLLGKKSWHHYNIILKNALSYIYGAFSCMGSINVLA